MNNNFFKFNQLNNYFFILFLEHLKAKVPSGHLVPEDPHDLWPPGTPEEKTRQSGNDHNK